jgi:predicted NUDIX family NTP pyrophosphohydrolase
MSGMPKLSAGLLVYRSGPDHSLEVLLAHPGGPLWKKRDDGAWTIPKGEVEKGHELLATADREFAEELGSPPPSGPRIDLGQVTQKSGKIVRAWAVAGEFDVTTATSNTFEMEWPRGSGRMAAFPEIDRAAWFTTEDARRKLVEAQTAFLDRLVLALDVGADEDGDPSVSL